MPPVTRNQLKSEMGTPSKTPTSKSPDYKKSSSSKFMHRVDPTKLTFLQIVIIGVVVAASILGGSSYLFLTGKVNLHGRYTIESMRQLSGRLEFVLRYQALGVAWLTFTTALVIARRFATGALNPLDGYDHHLIAQRNIHQNSLEQYILNVSNQLILITHLAPELLLRVIPLMNVLFIVGRILFWLGYPKYRTAGFTINTITITSATVYNLYGFFRFIGLI